MKPPTKIPVDNRIHTTTGLNTEKHFGAVLRQLEGSKGSTK